MSFRPIELPPLIVLTDRTLVPDGCTLVEQVASCIDAGARALVLREKDLPRDERAALAATIRPLMTEVDGVLIVASDASIPADGVHLAAAEAMPMPRPAIVGRSCHSLDEARAAAAEGCDYATLSPILSSASKPGYGPALGMDVLQTVCEDVSIPVYALGGLDDFDIERCCDQGAAGVAVMGAAMARRFGAVAHREAAS